MSKENKKNKKVKRTRNISNNKVNQKGGDIKLFNDPINWNSMHKPSTSGSFGNFVGNIFGLVESSVNSVVDTVNLITETIRIPMDLGKAMDGPSDPTPYNVTNI